MQSPAPLLQSPRLLTLLYALMQVVKAGLTLCLVLLSASMFGAGVQREAWVIGWGAQMWLFKLFFTPLNETFRARFLQLKDERGGDAALASTRRLLLFVSAVALAAVLGIICFSKTFMLLIAPGYFQSADQEQIRLMTIYLAPVLLISEWTSLLTALLNCYKSFYLPELLSLLTIVLNLLLLWLAGDQLGVYAFVWANYISLLVLLFLLFRQVMRLGLFSKNIQTEGSSVKPFLLFTAPLYLSAMAAQLNVWSERRMLSYLKMGSNAALDYARKFTDAPVILIVSLSTAVVAPLLSVLLNGSGIDGKAFRKECYLFVRSCFLILAPVILMCTYGAEDLVASLLLHGRFDAQWGPALVRALQWFAVGLPGTVLCVVMGQVLLVQKRSVIYAVIAGLAQLLPIAVNYYLFRKAGIEIFACTWSLMQYVMGIALLVVARQWDKRLLLQLLAVILLMATASALTILICSVIDFSAAPLRLIMLGLVSTVLILCGLFLFRYEEAVLIRRLLKKLPWRNRLDD